MVTHRSVGCKSLQGKDLDNADLCNLYELALASLGYVDAHPQVSLGEIERYVKEQLGKKFLPVK